MSTPYRFPLLAAGIFGATGVGLGAFGAHALRAALTELGTRDRWETAVFYQLVHTIALFGAAVWLRASATAAADATSSATKLIGWATRCWSVGIVFFSGALYFMSVSAGVPLVIKAAVPPLGGTLFIVGWLLVLSAGLVKQK